MTKTLIMATLFSSILMLTSCATIPKGVKAVEPFDSQKYLGIWHEVARIDFKFEKNMNQNSATYVQNEDGTIKVINRGYDYKKGIWKEAIGKAKFVKDKNKAMLKVSFFGPFYGGYNVVALDSEYKYALVMGSSPKYAWILSRETSIPQDIKESYLNIARNYGVKVSELIWDIR